MEKWIIVLSLIVGCFILIKMRSSHKTRKFVTQIGELKGALVFRLSELALPGIKDTIDMARSRIKKKIIVIFQPYDYKVLNSQFDEFCHCFNLAEKIVITPVYDPKLIPYAKKTTDDLYKNLQSQGENVVCAKNQPEIEDILQNIAITEDYMIFFIGTGSISQWADEIVRNIGIHA